MSDFVLASGIISSDKTHPGTLGFFGDAPDGGCMVTHHENCTIFNTSQITDGRCPHCKEQLYYPNWCEW